MVTLVADIGGTYARFAIAEDNKLHNLQKLAVDDFPDLGAALDHYNAPSDKAGPNTLYIATAATENDASVWSFHNNNQWIINREALELDGWSLPLCINDFVASALGAISLPDKNKNIVKAGTSRPDYACAVLGPGTGLGLAFLFPLGNGRYHVQQSFGGHMLAAACTGEQRLILRLISRFKARDMIIVPEDMISGSGLPILYRAVCLKNGQKALYENTEQLFDNAQDLNIRETLRLFHEFLGLFAHNAVVTGHAYGGLYLDGGIINRLIERDLFDFETFERFMVLNTTPVVKEMLASTPITIVKDPYVALRGLLEIISNAA